MSKAHTNKSKRHQGGDKAGSLSKSEIQERYLELRECSTRLLHDAYKQRDFIAELRTDIKRQFAEYAKRERFGWVIILVGFLVIFYATISFSCFRSISIVQVGQDETSTMTLQTAENFNLSAPQRGDIAISSYYEYYSPEDAIWQDVSSILDFKKEGEYRIVYVLIGDDDKLDSVDLECKIPGTLSHDRENYIQLSMSFDGELLSQRNTALYASQDFSVETVNVSKSEFYIGDQGSSSLLERFGTPNTINNTNTKICVFDVPFCLTWADYDLIIHNTASSIWVEVLLLFLWSVLLFIVYGFIVIIYCSVRYRRLELPNVPSPPLTLSLSQMEELLNGTHQSDRADGDPES